MNNTRLKKSSKPYDWNGRTVYIGHDRRDGFVMVTDEPGCGKPHIAPYDELTPVLSRFKPLINKLSDNKAKENKVYLTLRKVFLENHKFCEANLKGCTKQATEVHHGAGRLGKRLIDVKTFVALCSSCHRWAEMNVLKAKEIGLSVNRLC